MMKIALPWLALFLLHMSLVEVDGAGCCLFDGNDADDCVVYGSLDGKLKAWPKADQACLDAYKIKKDAPDPTLVCTSANSFVNALKNGALSTSKAKFGLGIPYGGFWVESSNNPDIPVLKDSITIDGTSYDCEASQGDCYNAMKPYFGSNADGKKEMGDVCSQMENEVLVARELEQSTLRVRLCLETREETAILADCTEMLNAMQSDLEEYSSLTCGGFGTGPAGLELPADCASASSRAPLGSTSGSESTMKGGNLLWCIACAVVGYLAI